MKLNKINLIIYFGLIGLLLVPVSAYAKTFQNPIASSASAPDLINTIIGKILIILVSISASLALLAIVISGIRFILGSLSGNEQEVAKAKQYLLWAIIGLMVVGASLLILMSVAYVLGLSLTPL